VQEVAEEIIDEAAATAASSAADRLQARWQEPAEPENYPDVASRFTAFEEACQLPAPYCAGIQLSWDADFGLPIWSQDAYTARLSRGSARLG
jgi:hypothetical protein